MEMVTFQIGSSIYGTHMQNAWKQPIKAELLLATTNARKLNMAVTKQYRMYLNTIQRRQLHSVKPGVYNMYCMFLKKKQLTKSC